MRGPEGVPGQASKKSPSSVLVPAVLGVLKTLLSSGEPVCPPPCLEVCLPGLHASEGIHIRGALCTIPAMEQKYQ